MKSVWFLFCAFVIVVSLSSASAAGEKKYYELSDQALREIDVIMVPGIRAAYVANQCRDVKFDSMKMKSHLWRVQNKHDLSNPQVRHFLGRFNGYQEMQLQEKYFASKGMKRKVDEKKFCNYAHAQIKRGTAVGRYLKKR